MRTPFPQNSIFPGEKKKNIYIYIIYIYIYIIYIIYIYRYIYIYIYYVQWFQEKWIIFLFLCIDSWHILYLKSFSIYIKVPPFIDSVAVNSKEKLFKSIFDKTFLLFSTFSYSNYFKFIWTTFYKTPRTINVILKWENIDVEIK